MYCGTRQNKLHPVFKAFLKLYCKAFSILNKETFQYVTKTMNLIIHNPIFQPLFEHRNSQLNNLEENQKFLPYIKQALNELLGRRR